MQNFLEYCLDALKLDTIHLVAHSMGNRLLTKALTTMVGGRNTMNLGQIVFAAPDVDSDIFKSRAAAFPPKAARYTLYTSKTLRISQSGACQPLTWRVSPRWKNCW